MTKARKAEIKSLTPAQALSARNTYVTNQFNRLDSSRDSAFKPKMKIIAEHGYTNFLELSWSEVDDIRELLSIPAMTARTAFHIDALTEAQALAWLVVNDREGANYWLTVSSGELVEAVRENLRDFGDESQNGCFEVTL